jgi:hypothetical protein
MQYRHLYYRAWGERPSVAWYQQRRWIEEFFKDAHSRFGLKLVQIGYPLRLLRFLAAFTLALCWLALLALPNLGALPEGWVAAPPARLLPTRPMKRWVCVIAYTPLDNQQSGRYTAL